jgi:hypothetical protein
MRIMATYWISVEHEMKLRLGFLLDGAGRPEWDDDPDLTAQRDLFASRFLEDMRELVSREGIVSPWRIDELGAEGYELSVDWADRLRGWQEATEAGLKSGEFPHDLMENWFDSCLRSVANYNRYLIWGGVVAAALVKAGGEDALRRAVDTVAEDFMWEVSREFFARVMPAAGFEDIGDLMELGLRGMFSDQYYVSGEERTEEDVTVKESVLKNCELAGIMRRVAEWNDLPPRSLGYAVCRFCEVHGLSTMLITIPPMYRPDYRLVRSIALDDEPCVYELKLTEADDMERLMRVQEKVFGDIEF